MVEHERWADALPEHGDFIRSLPDAVDRWDLRDLVAALPLDDQRNIRAFILSQIWGHGENGYGPWRVREALSTADGDGPRRINHAAAELERNGPVAGFDYLSGVGRLERVRTAFITKFLFTLEPDAALILDKRVRDWLADNVGVSLRVDRHTGSYREYLERMSCWAAGLGAKASELELAIFDAAMRGSGGQWDAT